MTPLPARKHHTQSDKTHGNDAKMALMYWVRIQLEDYIAADMLPSIQDFSRSWRTGLAFCLLLHRHDPMLIPDMLSTRIKADLTAKETWHDMLTMAFSIARDQLAIPQFLEPEDLIDVEYPYEPSVMVYVSEYYKVMSRTQQADTESIRKEKAAQRRIAIARALGDDDLCDSVPSTPPPLLADNQGQEEHEEEIQDSTAATTTKQQHAISLEEDRAPQEAPIPVPIPSYARRRKGHQIGSTLAEQDKARIKADLNSRLMMQLTGHLPRGVNPVLDQLLNIHDTITSFIKTNTRTIDEIPEEFMGSESIQEYMEALDIIQDQAASEAAYLDIAKQSRDKLLSTTSHDDDDDDSTMQLTELQQTQVGRLYDSLVKEWKYFQELLHNTKTDMLRVESELVGTEHGIRVYTRQAGLIQTKLEALLNAKVTPSSHPLDGDADTMLQSYNQALVRVSSDIQTFDTTTWRSYRAMMRELSPSVRQSVASQHAALQQRYEQVEDALKDSKRQVSLFRRGVALAKSLAALDDTLASIDVSTHDDAMLMELETRVSMIHSKLNALEQEYVDLLKDSMTYQAAFVKRMNELHDRRTKTTKAIEQVQRWMIEAKRIREWIEARITLVQYATDPLSMDFDLSSPTHQHDQLKREVELFEADDIARVKKHLGELNKSALGPVDSAISVILQELLDLYQQLLNGMQNVDLAILRVTWEQLVADDIADNIRKARHDLDQFIAVDGEAHWSSVSDKTKANLVMTTFNALETRVTAIEKSLGKAEQLFQSMEKMMHGELVPDHMVQRRLDMMNDFSDISHRCQFARKVVVDQHVPAVNILSLMHEMTDHVNKDARQFKFDVTSVLQDIGVKIAYPEDEPWMTEVQAQRNQDRNSQLRSSIRDYTEQLARMADKLLDDQLSLQERVDLLLEDTSALTNWLAQCTKRRGSWKSVARQLQQSDGYERLMDRARRLEEEIDETNDVSIDRTALIDALEQLETSHEQFQRFVKERQQASSQWEQLVLPVAQDLWSFIIKVTFDPSRHHVDTTHVYDDELQGLEKRAAGIVIKDGLYDPKELACLVTYATSTLEQRESILQWLSKVNRLIDQGRHVRDQLEEKSDAVDDKVICFKRALSNITLLDRAPEAVVDHWDLGIQEHHIRTQHEIQAFVDQKKNELRDIEGSLDRLYNAHQSSDKLKQLVELYDTEVTELRDWITKHLDQLRQCHVDALADLSEAQLLERQQKHARFVADIELFEETNIHTLQENIAQLQHDSLQQRLDQVLLDMEELKSIMTTQSNMFDAALKRADWESQCVAATSRLKDMLQRVGKSYELTADTIEQRHEQLRMVEEEKQAFVQQELIEIDTAYKAFGEALVQCHRSTTTIPVHMEARMDSLFRMKRRLSESLEQQMRHVDQAKQRMNWQQQVDRVLDQLAEYDQLVESFVQEQARWTPERDTETHDQPLLEQHYQELKSEIDQYRETHVKKLWENDNTDDVSVDKQQALHKADSKLDQHVMIVGDITRQHGMIAAFISQTSQLEAMASVIREELLRDHRQEGLQDRLKQFREDVDRICHETMQGIQYPVRPHFKIQDESINEVIRDLLAARTRRLDEVADSLKLQWESKELMTRYQVQLQLYKKHAEAIESWMKERADMIATHKKLLDDASKEPLDMKHLQQAISALVGLERTMKKTRDNTFVSLQSLFDQCASAFDDAAAHDENEDESLDEFDAIEATQQTMQDTWHRLRDDTCYLAAALTTLLEPTERYHRSSKLLTLLTELQRTLDDEDAALLSDDNIFQWQKKVDSLDNVYHDLTGQLQRVQSSKNDAVRQVVQSTQRQLDTAGESIAIIRGHLTSLYDTVNINRLRKTYSENAAVVINMMMRAQDLFKDTCTQFNTVTAEDRVAQRHALVAAHKDAQRRWTECRDAYDDLCGYNDFIRGQENMTSEMDELYGQVQDEWNTLQGEQDALIHLVERIDQWVERYDIVDQLQRALGIIQRDMEEKRKMTSYSSSTTSSSIKSKSSSDSEGNMLAALDKRLNSVTRDLDELLHDANEDKEHDRANSIAFIEHAQHLSAHISNLRSSLTQRRVELDKANLLTAYGDEIKRQTILCEEQIGALKQQSTSNPSIAEKKPAAIQTVISTYSSTLSMARRVHTRCKDSLVKGTLADQATKLVDSFGVLKSETDRMKRPLERLLNDLDQRINVENAYVGILDSVCNHAQSEGEMLASLNEFKETVARFARSARIARTKGALLPDLAEFERRYNDIETAVQDFLGMGSKIKSGFHRIHGMTTRIASVNRSMDRRQDTIKREWARIRVSAEETKAKLQDTQMRQHASAKLAEAIRFVGELKHRIMQLDGKSMAEEQQEFKEIQDAMTDGLAKRLADADQLVATVVDKDGKFKRQRQELTSLVQELEALVKERQEQAEMEGNMALFMDILDTMKDQMARMTRLVQESIAPESSPELANNRVSKGDLQAQLRKLVNGYKEIDMRMNELTESARSEARKQFMDTSVANRLDTTLEEWSQVQAKVTAREKELQSAIQQLDQEFFTKLSMAKSISPGGRPSRRQTPTPPPPPPPTAASNRNKKPRRQSVHNRRRTPTPTSSKKYVADPKNELDVHLGRIVNDSPYRMKIKRVSGEVGKYWFGDEHPRLVYCRILPSKVVMVRVGGGWLELTKFLKSKYANWICLQDDTNLDVV